MLHYHYASFSLSLLQSFTHVFTLAQNTLMFAFIWHCKSETENCTKRKWEFTQCWLFSLHSILYVKRGVVFTSGDNIETYEKKVNTHTYTHALTHVHTIATISHTIGNKEQRRTVKGRDSKMSCRYFAGEMVREESGHSFNSNSTENHWFMCLPVLINAIHMIPQFSVCMPPIWFCHIRCC